MTFCGGQWLVQELFLKEVKHRTWIVESTCLNLFSPRLPFHDFFSAVFAMQELSPQKIMVFSLDVRLPDSPRDEFLLPEADLNLVGA